MEPPSGRTQGRKAIFGDAGLRRLDFGGSVKECSYGFLLDLRRWEISGRKASFFPFPYSMSELQTVTIGTKTYFIDRRLNELRNVENSHECVAFRTPIELEIVVAGAQSQKWGVGWF